jgi:hypothetical protein
MVEWPLPIELVCGVAQLRKPLHGRLAWRLLPLLRGMRFAQSRRTVARWLRAAGPGEDVRQYSPLKVSFSALLLGQEPSSYNVFGLVKRALRGRGLLGPRRGSGWLP